MPNSRQVDARKHGQSGRGEATRTASRGARPTQVTQAHAATVERLQAALNQTFTVYRDTHLAHFNVRGPSFPQLHTLFEAQYNELWLALDEVAERIRALGHVVTHSSLALSDSRLPADSDAMLSYLRVSHVQSVVQWQEIFEVAEKAGDHATGDLCNARIRAHQKHAWMLEATVEP